MRSFRYVRPKTIEQAVDAVSSGTRFIGGGTNLLDLMKEDVERPTKLVDVNGLPMRKVEGTQTGGLRIGALVTNSELAYHPEVERRYPLLSQAILAGASPQLRNMATTAGNLLQRTRCYYFYDTGTPCNKRQPGSGCPAIAGRNRIHAVLGQSEHCIAVHPSDMCVALCALEAVIHVCGPGGERQILFSEFHRLAGDTPELDTNLASDELITAVELPECGFPSHYAYIKLRDRQSYAFALVSVATALELDGDTVKVARIALGGVAHKPWRRPEVEAALVGQKVGLRVFREAAEGLLEGARGYRDNSFKIELARRAIVRALLRACKLPETRKEEG